MSLYELKLGSSACTAMTLSSETPATPRSADVRDKRPRPSPVSMRGVVAVETSPRAIGTILPAGAAADAARAAAAWASAAA